MTAQQLSFTSGDPLPERPRANPPPGYVYPGPTGDTIARMTIDWSAPLPGWICTRCGAVVAGPVAHDAHHADLARMISALDSLDLA